MLTRLKVKGFKNLVDVDIRFGPFTCIAGPNGSGKSNLFDVITFLSDLTNDTLINSAVRIRGESGKTSNIRNIFHRAGRFWADTIEIEAEMLIPKEGIDNLGQQAIANSTFVRYGLAIRYREQHSPSLGALEIVREELTHFKVSDSPKYLRFPHDVQNWRNSVVMNKRTTPYISTEEEGGNTVIKLRPEGRQGRARTFLARNLPRTILSSVNATENPTVLLTRKEMESWRLLQLEPSALREPDTFAATPGIASTGAHMPITLYALANKIREEDGEGSLDTTVFEQVSLSLNRLLDDVRSIRVVRDEIRESYTLEVSDGYGTFYPARSLSDGTLRFLALAVLSIDPKSPAMLCLEEPENGIHPERIPAILGLLQDMCVDTFNPISPANPFRQVIVNTHSPSVVALVDDDSLLVSHLQEIRIHWQIEENIRRDEYFKTATFSWLSDTWRADADPDIHTIAPGKVSSYLFPQFTDNLYVETTRRQRAKKPRRVKERPEFQLSFSFSEQS